MAVVSLALLYPALAWSRSLLAIMDIRARSVSLRSALEGQLGHQITNATARPFSVLQLQLADLGGDGTSAAREAANIRAGQTESVFEIEDAD